MSINDHLFSLWESTENFRFSHNTDQVKLCVFARAFQEWIALLQRDILTNTPSVITVNQAKVLLVDRYFDWLQNVPKNHRNRLGETGHTCIYQIFTRAYQHIRTIELSLVPPLLFLPAKPQIPGLFLGDLTERGDE